EGIAAGQAAAEASSPSQKARREIGQPIGEGAALGVEDSAPAAINSVRDMIEAIFSLVQERLGDLGLTVQEEMTAAAEDAAPASQEAASDLGAQMASAMLSGMDLGGDGIGGQGIQAALENALQATAGALTPHAEQTGAALGS